MRFILWGHSFEILLGRSRGEEARQEWLGPLGSQADGALQWRYSWAAAWAETLALAAAILEGGAPTEKHLVIGVEAAAGGCLERYWRDGTSLAHFVYDQLAWHISACQLWRDAKGAVGRRLIRRRQPVPPGFHRLIDSAADLAVRMWPGDRPAYLLPEHILLVLADSTSISEGLRASGLDLSRLRRAIESGG